ncbi:MAG: AraC family transcriptional regulator [Kangiellaceae bacterium]|nr:AraC family transcriptional regulator [Kangiellaceae bacterium]
MSQILTFIFAIGAFQGLVLFALLVSDQRVNYASKLLGVMCLFIASSFALPLIVEAGNGPLAWLIAPLVFLPACYGGLTYLYCSSAITGSKLKPLDLLHLIPLIICYLLNYEILLAPEKAIEFVRMHNDATLTKAITAAIIFAQVVLYIGLIISMLFYYQNKAKQTLSSYNPDVFKWLWSLTAFFVIFWGLVIFFNYISRIPSINLIAYAILVLMVYFIGFVQWRNPSIFHIQKLDKQPEIKTKPDTSEGLLDQEMRSSILQEVKEKVKKEALYRNSELTLATLAEYIGVSVHHLSETLNQQGGKNFNQFINEYRVAEVCEQLKQKNKRNLIDLALDAGFSSKSSFNATFKKLTGKAPSVYRQEIT